MQPFIPYTLNIGGTMHSIERPWVMAIVNATDDSFFDRSRCATPGDVEERVDQILRLRADIIDLGACSTRPGSQPVDEETERERLDMALEVITKKAPASIISVDTFRASIAHHCVTRWGVNMINDISGGQLDPDMITTVAKLGVPFVATHNRVDGNTTFDGDVAAVVLEELARTVDRLHQAGVNDVIADPGFGFAKTVEQNYRLLSQLEAFHALGVPLLVGVSRKRMAYEPLGIKPTDALNATTALHTMALMKGAHILRVHDIEAAQQACTLVELTRKAAEEPSTSTTTTA